MTQSRWQSLIEAKANTVLGLGINLGGQYVFTAAAGIPMTHAQHLGMAAFFTVLSVTRNYVVRRWFNWLLIRGTA